jgi:hypothetical protein
MHASLLSLATAWGLYRSRRWSRWTGLLACACLLPGLPWFTIIGVAGFAVLLVNPLRLGALPNQPTIKPLQDYWTAARDSRTQKVVISISGALLIVGLKQQVAGIPYRLARANDGMEMVGVFARLRAGQYCYS